MSDSSNFFASLEHHFNNQLPFVAYRKPKLTEVKSLLQKDDKLHLVSDFSESGFVMAPFDDREEAILIPLDTSEINSVSFDITAKEEFSRFNDQDSIQDKCYHINLVQKGIDSIHDRKLKKVVLSRSEAVDISESNPIKIFKRLLQTYSAAFVYCWYHPKKGLWLGASPETLLKIAGDSFSTVALAGTQIYNGTLDVEWKDKEIQEQQLVTNYIVENLKPLTVNLDVSDIETVKAGKLLHIQTEIKGTKISSSFSLKNVLNSLHPTPAICGIKRDMAKEFILEQENYNREFYTGFLGTLNGKDGSELFVNLRCMQIKDHSAIIYVGGGITKDSDPENEWIETVNKTNTIKMVLS
ncbi:MAG: isochorismate synthase [Bacteroidia bacterium]|nr:isochorismate synthase [Bacteroidia bacterium]